MSRRSRFRDVMHHPRTYVAMYVAVAERGHEFATADDSGRGGLGETGRAATL